MKRGFFIALLMLSSGPAYSEWVAVGDNVELDTIYIDLETFRRDGELAEIWVMTDSKLAKRFLIRIPFIHRYVSCSNLIAAKSAVGF